MKPEKEFFDLKCALVDLTVASTEHGDRVEFEEKVYDKVAEAIAAYVDAALLTARNQGRDEGLEEAAKMAEKDTRSTLAKKYFHEPEWHKRGKEIAAAIRAKIGEHGNG